MFHNLYALLLATVFCSNIEFSRLSWVVDGSDCFPLHFFHGFLFFSHKNFLMVWFFFSLLKQILTCQLVPKFQQAFATALNFKEEL